MTLNENNSENYGVKWLGEGLFQEIAQGRGSEIVLRVRETREIALPKR